MDSIYLLWRFLEAQPPSLLIGLVSWHLLAVLLVLSVLSAFGLHFLIGHLFRFYRRKGSHARWLAWPTQFVFLLSVPALLLTYLLAVEAPSLVRANLNGGVTSQLGRHLLAPAFESPALQSVHPDEVPKASIRTALAGIAEVDYRERLRAGLRPPDTNPAEEATSQLSGSGVLVQMGLQWVTAPHNTWFAPLRAVDQRPLTEQQGDEAFFLPDFLASLIDELQEGTVLPRLDWEHVAGTRYVEGVLRPVMEEYLTYLALVLALGILLLDGLYFVIMRRLKRIGQSKPTAKPVSAATKPAPPAKKPPPPVPAPPPAPPATSGQDSAVPEPADSAPDSKADTDPTTRADEQVPAAATEAQAIPESKEKLPS